MINVVSGKDGQKIMQYMTNNGHCQVQFYITVDWLQSFGNGKTDFHADEKVIKLFLSNKRVGGGFVKVAASLFQV